jgi:hypothetical protein
LLRFIGRCVSSIACDVEDCGLVTVSMQKGARTRAHLMRARTVPAI